MDYRSEAPAVLRDFLSYHETIKGHSRATVDEYFLDLRNFFRYLKIERGRVPRSTELDEISIKDIDLDFIASVTLNDVYDYMAFLSRDKVKNERSREPEKIIEECRGLIAEGYKEITLLGQNVNSYGKDLDTDYDFADLLAAINAIPGDYWLRFMSSQPKDATNKLFDTMARCEHVAKQLHLPVQSGCDRVLKAMNRPYTRAKYEEMIAYARSVMPSMVLTSDVIIGFPGETEDEAMQTVDLVEKTQFDALFTFIFSPRPGTPAAKMDDPVSREEKQVWFEKLVDAQNAISAKKHAAYIGRTVKVLVDGESDDEAFPLAARTEGNRLVRMKGDKALIGTFAKAKITDSNTWALYGEVVEE